MNMMSAMPTTHTCARVVHHDLVDHHLGEKRRGERTSWIASEASSTSRQIFLCLSSSG